MIKYKQELRQRIIKFCIETRNAQHRTSDAGWNVYVWLKNLEFEPIIIKYRIARKIRILKNVIRSCPNDEESQILLSDYIEIIKELFPDDEKELLREKSE